jgi:PAS domain S-box-containing protein
VFGWAPAEMLGQSIERLFPPEERQAGGVADELVRGAAGGVAEERHRRLRKDGTAFIASVSAHGLRDEAGRLHGYVKVVRDVTEQMRLEDQREELLAAEREARAEAERVGRMKDEFLATLSHELRTPLNAIAGWAQLIRTGRLPDADARQAVEVISRNAQAQKQLIEDLLDMSRIISGKVRLDVQRVDLAAVVAAAVESVQPTAEAKGVRLEKVIDPHAGPVSGDPNRLQQVVWNLLTNAIKFTPRGGKVQVTLERVNSHLEVCVSDTGAGIRPEFLPHVFDRFAQADASTTRRHGGLGLGLSIVKQLVEMHSGQVRAKSPGEGLGSTFIVALPLAVIRHDGERGVHPAAAAADAGPEAEPVTLDGLRVLVVDDDPDGRELVRRVLGASGATVVTAGSAAEGLEAVERERPDVIVSDIGMPGVDGYEFIRRVRALGRGRGGAAPAVAVTAFARSEDRRRALRAGYQSHVAKPMDAAELVEVIASVAGRPGGGAGVGEPA